MKVAYIMHPVSGDVEGNKARIIDIIRKINLEEPETVPFAPYLNDLSALDDNIPEERERGIKNDMQLIKSGFITEARAYGPKISNGMLHEIREFLKLAIPVIDCSGNNLKIPTPELICNNCGWIGAIDDLKTLDYPTCDSVCPDCQASSVKGDVIELHINNVKGITFKVNNSTTYRLSDKQGNIVRIIVEPSETNPNGGNLTISGDFGNYSYYWGAMGKGGMKSFLCSLNMEYLADKLGMGNHFNFEKSIAANKMVIIRGLREGQGNYENARETFNSIKDIESQLSDLRPTEECFYSSFYEHIISSNQYLEYPEIVKEIHPKFVRFWDTFWIPFTEYLKRSND